MHRWRRLWRIVVVCGSPAAGAAPGQLSAQPMAISVVGDGSVVGEGSGELSYSVNLLPLELLLVNSLQSLWPLASLGMEEPAGGGDLPDCRGIPATHHRLCSKIRLATQRCCFAP